MFIADVAARDPRRPGYTVERASKILASSTWSGSGYTSLYQNTEEVREALKKAGIKLVVTDGSAPSPGEHEKLLSEAIKGAAAEKTAIAIRDGKQSGEITLARVAH